MTAPQHHIHCLPGDVGRYVLMPGDPGRVPVIARLLDDARPVVQHREYTTYTGWLLGEKVSVTSTGIGCPSTAIAVEELSAIGADTFIRVGTSGGMQSSMRAGDLAIATAAIRDEGTSRQYMPLEFPAVAHLDTVLALRDAARALGFRHHVGVLHSKDSFYGETQPQRMPVRHELESRWAAWVQGGALSSEMEAATLFVVSSVLGKRAGGIMLVSAIVGTDDRLRGEARERAIADVLAPAAVQAVRLLIRRDRGEAA